MHGASLATHDDHRLAMAFAIAKLRIKSIEVQNPEVVSKSWPNYFRDLDSFFKK